MALSDIQLIANTEINKVTEFLEQKPEPISDNIETHWTSLAPRLAQLDVVRSPDLGHLLFETDAAFSLLSDWSRSSPFAPVQICTFRVCVPQRDEQMDRILQFCGSLPVGICNIHDVILDLGVRSAGPPVNLDLLAALCGKILRTGCRKLSITCIDGEGMEPPRLDESAFHPSQPLCNPLQVAKLQSLALRGSIFFAKEIIPWLVKLFAGGSVIEEISICDSRLDPAALEQLILLISSPNLSSCEFDGISLSAYHDFLRRHPSITRIDLKGLEGDLCVHESAKTSLVLPYLTSLRGSARQIACFATLLADRPRRFSTIHIRYDQEEEEDGQVMFDAELYLRVLRFLGKPNIEVDRMQVELPSFGPETELCPFKELRGSWNVCEMNFSILGEGHAANDAVFVCFYFYSCFVTSLNHIPGNYQNLDRTSRSSTPVYLSRSASLQNR